MADVLGTGMNVDFTGIFGGMGTAIMYIIIGLGIAGLIYLVFWWISFKYKVRVRELVAGGADVIRDDKAKRYKDRDGVYWWKLRKLRTKFPEPPSECIDINHRGKKMLEVYRADDGSFIPIMTSFDYSSWKKEQIDSKEAKAFKPFATNQRAMLVHEYRESESYKQRKLSDIVMALAPYVAIVLILAIFMIFFGEVVKPMTSAGDAITKASDKLAVASDNMESACLGKVKLQVETLTNGSTSSPGNPPN